MRFFEDLLATAIGAVIAYVACVFFKRNRPRGRRRRHQHFLSQRHGTQIGISPDLLQSAHCLLVNSLEERKKPVWRTRNNHSTKFAPGVIVMVMTAFDVWLSEQIGFSRMTLSVSDEQVESIIEKPAHEKYDEMVRALGGQRTRIPTDLRLLSTLRHEIVHFLPYTQDISSGKTVPDWLSELAKRHLLISSGDPSVDFHFGQKLGSYALAYWACETVFLAAQAFAAAFDPNNPVAATTITGNFAFHQSVTAPSGLEQFDRQFGLSLTR